MKQLHRIQLEILKKLLFTESLRYSDLKPHVDIENNQLQFHLDQLQELGWVQKIDKKYSLTPLGKEYANRIDTDDVRVIHQAKIGVFLCGIRGENGNKEYLLMTRLKHPFYKCQGFISGKVAFGEKVVETAKRELYEETNLVGEPYVVSIKHYRVFDAQTGQLVEDKFVYFCRVDNPFGELRSSEESEVCWVPDNSLGDYVTKPVESFEVFNKQIQEIVSFSGQISFEEIDSYTNNF